MSFTRDQVETALIGPARLGQFLLDTGVDITLPPNNDSPRPAFSDCITSAMLFCGVQPADPTAPTDTDLLRLADYDRQGRSNWMKLVDVAEFEFLQGFFNKIATGIASSSFTNFKTVRNVNAMDRARVFLLTTLQLKYGYGVSRLTRGSVKVVSGGGCRSEF